MRQSWWPVWRNLTWLAIGLLVAAAALNLYSRPPVPMIGPDAVGYFGPTLAEYRTGKFESIATRGMLYPLFVRELYRLGGSAEFVVQAQRALFVLALVLIALLFKEAYRAFFRRSNLARVSLAIAAFGSLAYVGFNAEITGFVDYLHPEGLTVFTMLVAMLLVVMVVRRLCEGRAPALMLIALGTLLPVLAFFQARWALLPPLLLVYLLWKIVGVRRGSSVSSFLLSGALVLSFMSSFIVLAEATKQFLANDTMNISIVSRSLFAVNMNSIAKVMTGDLEKRTIQDAATVEGMLDFYRRSKTPEAERYSTGGSATLGYNVDFLNSIDAYIFLEKRLARDHNAMNAFYRGWVIAAFATYPVDMISKIVRELASMTFSIPKFFWSQGPCEARMAASAQILQSWRALFDSAEIDRVEKIYLDNRHTPCASAVVTDTWFAPVAKLLNAAYSIAWIVFGGFALAWIASMGRLSRQPVWLFALWSAAISASISTSFFVQPIRYSEDLHVASLLLVVFFVVSMIDIVFNRVTMAQPKTFYKTCDCDWD